MAARALVVGACVWWVSLWTVVGMIVGSAKDRERIGALSGLLLGFVGVAILAAFPAKAKVHIDPLDAPE